MISRIRLRAGAGGHTISIGQSTESNTAQILTTVNSILVNQSTENDSAFLVSKLKNKSLPPDAESPSLR